MFTVVIPLYNKELSIENTIDSVLNQTYQNFEVIVVNDGSTDNSAGVVEAINDDRIKLIHQKNQGVSAARNCGIKAASKEWIAFLDGDDLWEANHLEEIIKMMIAFPDEKVYVTTFEISDEREMFKHPRKNSIFKIEDYFKEAISESLIWTSVVVINKECFNKVGDFNIKLNRGEDLDLWARLAREYQIIKSSLITAIYKVDAENRTSLSKKLEETHVYYFDFDSIHNDFEKDYYKAILLNRLYAYSRSGDLLNVMKLKNRYEHITWIEYFTFMLNTIKKRLSFYRE